MKKHFSLLTAAMLMVTLAACTPAASSSVVSSSSEPSSISSSLEESSSSDTSTSLSSSSSSSISSSSSSSSTSSVEAPKEVKIGEVYTSNYWDITIENMLDTVLGDLSEKVPVFTSQRYEALMAYPDGSQTLTFQIKCYGANASSAMRIYKEKMEACGYYFSAENNYGYQMVDYYSDLFLAYSLEGADTDTPCFVIQTNIQQTREAEWNNNAVSLYTDLDNIPACPAESYSTSYDNSKDTLTVFALFVDRNTVVNKYMSELVKAGFTSQGTDQYGATTMIDSTGYVSVVLYLTYGDYDCDALYINFVNVWPSVGIASFTLLTQFPKVTSDTAKFDRYKYFDLVGNGNEQDYVLCIYFLYVSTSDYESYVDTLVDYGFAKGEVTVSETNIITTELDVSMILDTGAIYKINVEVLYQVASSIICIVLHPATAIKQIGVSQYEKIIISRRSIARLSNHWL